MRTASAEAQRPRGRKTRSLRCWAQVWRHPPQGFFCATLACFFCSLSQGSHQWVFWDTDNTHRVSIGIWKGCFLELLSNGKYTEARCQKLDVLERSMPAQILLAQLLMSFALLLQGLGMGFFFCAWGIAARKKPKTSIAPSLNRAAIFLSVLSGIITLIPAAYTAALVWGHKALAFPERYQTRFPREWHLGDGTYLALVSVALQVMGWQLLPWNLWRRCTKRRRSAEHRDPEQLRWLSSGSEVNLRDSNWASGCTAYLPASPPRVSLPRLPQLSFPAFSPRSQTPPLPPWAPPLRSTSLVLSSLTPRECLTPLRRLSLPDLSTLPPFSSTLQAILTSPPWNSPPLPQTPPLSSSSTCLPLFSSSPSRSPSQTDDLRAPSPIQLSSSPIGCSPIPFPTLAPLSTPPPPEPPSGLPPIDI